MSPEVLDYGFALNPYSCSKGSVNVDQTGRTA